VADGAAPVEVSVLADEELAQQLTSVRRLHLARLPAHIVILSTDPAEQLDRAAQLVGVHARVALGRVEVLVAEQLLIWPSGLRWSEPEDTRAYRSCYRKPRLRGFPFHSEHDGEPAGPRPNGSDACGGPSCPAALGKILRG